MDSFFNFFIDTYKSIAIGFESTWNWLTTNNNVLGLAPISLIGIGGLVALFGFIVVKVVLPI